MKALKNVIARLLRDIANKLDAGTSEISETEAIEIASMLTHHVMSKETACQYLNLSRSRFDDLVREKKLPKGRKRSGFRELIWWKDELDDCVRDLKK